MFTRILVPTDFSPPSDAALAYARTLAGTFRAKLLVLQVLESEFLRAVVADPHDLETAALRQLQEHLTDDDRRRLHAVAVIERSDEPADEIISYARSGNVDLIVMGTHGRSGLAHLLMGSVAEKVVRSAPCPVMTLRRVPPAPGKAGSGVSRVLVPTDFSAPSDAALACGRAVAERFGASLHLLHVLDEALVLGPIGSEVYLAESTDIRAARLKDAQERLAHRITGNDRTSLRATTEVIFGTPARTVVDYAADTGFDLIVMGTHGRTGVAHLLMGSVAESVVRTAPCPVLTVREALERVSVPVVRGVVGAATT